MAVKVILEREEVLASIIALQKERKPGEWSKSALRKLDNILRVNKERLKMSHYHFFEHERLPHEITNIKEDIDTACAKTARMVAEEIFGEIEEGFPGIKSWIKWQALKNKYLGG